MPAEEAMRMTTAGWVFLATSWALVAGLTVYSIVKVLTVRRDETDPERTPEE